MTEPSSTEPSSTRRPSVRRRSGSQFRAAPYLPLVLSLSGYASPLITVTPRSATVSETTLPPSADAASLGNGAFVDNLPGAETGGRSATQMKAHFIDVGQGAATLFEFSCGTVLVDTGGETNGEFSSGDALRSYLDDLFDRRPDLNRTIDLLVISHPHIDHTRNAKLVATEYTVKNVVTDGVTEGSGGPQQAWLQTWAKEKAHLETIRASEVPTGGKTSAIIDPVNCVGGDPKLKVLWGEVKPAPQGWTAEAAGNWNNHSVVLRLDFGKASFLMSGDLQEEGIEELLAKQRGSGALDVDIWEVSHHGSHNGVSGELLEAMTPKIALLGTGDPLRHVKWSAWQYGHPRKVATDMVLGALSLPRRPVEELVATRAKEFKKERIQKAAFATGWDGSVVVTASLDGTYSVETER